MRNIYFYIVIFVMGVLSSLLITFFAIRILPQQRKIQNFLSENHYLQVRDDYSVYMPTSHYFYGDDGIEIGAPIQKQIKKNDFEDELEALNSLKVAIDLRQQGKKDKAMKLFQHALALAPRHPEILTKYGEYLEQTHSDIITADSMYFQVCFSRKQRCSFVKLYYLLLSLLNQALTANPSHDEAMVNRQRTAGIVEALDQQRLIKLDEKRDALSAVHEANSALRRIKKEAYFQHIYHSVGIEGNTMTLAETRSVLETRMAVSGRSIDEHNEVLGLDAALKYINASLVNR